MREREPFRFARGKRDLRRPEKFPKLEISTGNKLRGVLRNPKTHASRENESATSLNILSLFLLKEAYSGHSISLSWMRVEFGNRPLRVVAKMPHRRSMVSGSESLRIALSYDLRRPEKLRHQKKFACRKNSELTGRKPRLKNSDNSPTRHVN